MVRQICPFSTQSNSISRLESNSLATSQLSSLSSANKICFPLSCPSISSLASVTFSPGVPANTFRAQNKEDLNTGLEINPEIPAFLAFSSISLRSLVEISKIGLSFWYFKRIALATSIPFLSGSFQSKRTI